MVLANGQQVVAVNLVGAQTIVIVERTEDGGRSEGYWAPDDLVSIAQSRRRNHGTDN
jgi:hypothetical protein